MIYDKSTHYSDLKLAVEILKKHLYTRTYTNPDTQLEEKEYNPSDSSHLPVEVVVALDEIEKEILKLYKVYCMISGVTDSMLEFKQEG